MRALLISVYYWLFVIIICIIFLPIAVVLKSSTFWFDKKLTILHKFTSFWGAVFVYINPLWSVKIIDRQKIDKNKVYVMVSNHQSMVDIMILYMLFTHFKWVSKIENYRVPILGWVMLLNKYIKINRTSRQSVMQMIKDCKDSIAEGNSILIFPEGTRSPNGELQSFKEGAFKIAHEAEVPVLPIIIEGSSRALPKSGLMMKRKEKIRLKVLDEIPPNISGINGPKSLMGHVRNIMLEEYKKLATDNL